jgi:hypothetical protein
MAYALYAGIKQSMAESYARDVSIKESRIFSRQSVRVGCAGWSIPRQGAAHFVSGGSHLERASWFEDQGDDLLMG